MDMISNAVRANFLNVVAACLMEVCALQHRKYQSGTTTRKQMAVGIATTTDIHLVVCAE